MAPRRNLFTYLATATLARAATEATGPALLLVSIAALGSGAAGSYLVASLTGAAAIGGPVVGALLDRSRRPRRAFSMAMCGLSAGIIAIAVLIGHAPLPALMALAAVTGLTYPALTGAWTAQLPPLITPSMLPRAYSADAGTYSVASIIGPPTAAALLAVSMTAPLWLPAALLVLALIMLRFVPLAPRPRHAHHSLVSDLRHGMSTIVRRLSLRRTIIITTIAFGGQAAVFICSPLIAQQLTGSLAFTGVIFGCLAAGGVLAAGVLLRFPVTRPDATIIVTTIISGIALAAIAVAQNLPLVLVAAFVIGLTQAPQLTAMFLIRSRESPERVRGQVFTTASSLRMSAFALGSAVFGSMLVFGTAAVIWGGVALHVIGLAIGLAAGPPIRRHRLQPKGPPVEQAAATPSRDVSRTLGT
ncbi:MAG: MFS transporter [Actinobacteria bacterium]|nr:MFS transporter [Actinomycetota bacterium]